MRAPLTNFNFHDYYKGNALFGGVHSRDNVPRLKNKFYIVNLDDYEGPGTHWIAIFNVYRDEIIYFDSFGVDPPEEILKKLLDVHKKMIMNTYRIQALNSENCGFFCIYVIDNLLKGRSFISISTDFDPNDFEKNDKKIKNYY